MNLPTALRVALVCLLVCSGAVAPVSSVAPSAPDLDASARSTNAVGAAPTVLLQQDGDAETNNSSVQHENPEEVVGGGDAYRVRGYLISRLAARLNGSVVSLTQAEYQRAREILGDEYNEDLEKLVDVAGETEETSGFETAAERQREYVQRVQQFQETREAYEDAVEAGNESRARERARELNEIANGVNRTEDDLLDGYTRIENATAANLSAETETIRTTTTNITETAAEIAGRELQETQLSLSVSDRTVSFLDPVQIAGTLETENGTAIANRTVRLRVGERTLTTETNRSGGFTVTYRPTLLPADTETLQVGYLPDGTSEYFPTNASVAVNVRPVTAEASMDHTAVAGFADEVTVHGRIEAQGVPVDDVPVRVSVDGVTLGVVRTTESGTYAVRTQLPADVSAGDVTVTTALAVEGRAVNLTPAEGTMTVEQTDTQLAVNATVENAEAGRVRVTGKLRAAGGTAVPGGSVDIRAGGRSLASVSTGTNGRFAATLNLPVALAERENVSLAAVFDPEGTNLNGSRARARVVLNSSADDESSVNVPESASNPFLPTGLLPESIEWLVFLGAGVLAVIGGAGVYVLTVSGDDAVAATAATSVTKSATGVAQEGDVSESGGDGTDDPFAEAAARLDDDPTVATQLAYLQVRDSLAKQWDVPPSYTPRETVQSFRLSSGDGGSDDARVAALERLTDVYERAVFGPTGVSTEEAADALADARTVSADTAT